MSADLPARSVASRRLLVWSIFGVAFALLPILVNALNAATRGTTASYGDLVGRGELLLTAAALSAAAAGELIASSARLDSIRLALAGINVLLVSVASVWFGGIAGAYHDGAAVDKGFVCIGSTLVLLFGFGISGATVVVSHLRAS